MRVFFAVIVCKMVRFIGKMIGRGSNLPGEIALKICPDILSRIKKPECIIAVTGSNGKTSTVELIASVLRNAGKSFAYNSEGSNQIEGVTTFILNECSVFGKYKKDYILIETDERFARHTFKQIVPTHYLILNLYRDQLTRNGHPQFVYDSVLQSIKPETQLILNANDPLTSQYGFEKDGIVYFSVDRFAGSTDEPMGVYKDYNYCPICFSKLDFDYYNYSEIGKFKCSSCGYKTNEADFRITTLDLENGKMIINDSQEIKMDFCNIYTAYNMVAAFALCKTIGIDERIIAETLSDHTFTSGRTITFRAGTAKGMLLTSKHENSVSYDQSISIAANDKRDVSVVIIVDAISRKYFTGEVSWLWDIGFEKLNSPNIKEIILSGKYCNDLENRFSYLNINTDKIKVIENIDDCARFIQDKKEFVYVITCFSDRDKFLSRVEREI